jgi:hypothetical protein
MATPSSAGVVLAKKESRDNDNDTKRAPSSRIAERVASLSTTTSRVRGFTCDDLRELTTKPMDTLTEVTMFPLSKFTTTDADDDSGPRPMSLSSSSSSSRRGGYTDTFASLPATKKKTREVEKLSFMDKVDFVHGVWERREYDYEEQAKKEKKLAKCASLKKYYLKHEGKFTEKQQKRIDKLHRAATKLLSRSIEEEEEE